MIYVHLTYTEINSAYVLTFAFNTKRNIIICRYSIVCIVHTKTLANPSAPALAI